MSMSFNRIIVLAAMSAILVILLGVFASRSLTTLNEGNDWIAHAQRVRYELSHFLQQLTDTGTGARRFETTHDEHSFDEAAAVLASIPAEMQDLHRTLADDPGLAKLEAQLAAAAARRIALSQQLIDKAQAGDVAGVDELLQQGESTQALETCRTIIGQMVDEENRILDSHRQLIAEARNTVAFAIVATTALAVLLLISVAYFSLLHSARLERVQRALIEGEAALREADQRKDVFLATLSHELRNPLAPIRNAARLLESPSLTKEDLQRSGAIISRQVRHMASLLDDLLDVSRITRGVLTLKKEVVALQGLFETAVETSRPAIDAKRHRLEVKWPPDTVKIRADGVRLTQVVTNLLTNAAKYTDPEGHITLDHRIEGSTVMISVRDTGFGLAPDMLTRVFEMFSQVAPERSQSDGGLGIGLALVKGLVELHGGRVEAHSAGLELGSEFTVYFPDSLVESAAAPAANDTRSESPTPRALRVLVADDNRDSAESLGMLLELSGHEVYLAHDGVEALAAASTQLPDVVLLDIGMPGMDGYEVAANIRREPWGAGMQLVAITGWGQEDAKRKARSSGFDHHLTKPMDSAVLESILANAARRT